VSDTGDTNNFTEEPPPEPTPEEQAAEPVIVDETPTQEPESQDSGLTAVEQRELALSQQAENDNKAVAIKGELQTAADELFALHYTNAAWRVVDAVTLIDAQQLREGTE
jgi:hypothetical protein